MRHDTTWGYEYMYKIDVEMREVYRYEIDIDVRELVCVSGRRVECGDPAEPGR